MRALIVNGPQQLCVEIPASSNGVLVEIIDLFSLPGTLRKRLHVRAAVIKVLETSLRQKETPVQSFVWLILLPRSRGQDLEVDFSILRGKKTFPAVVYGYSGTVAEKPLAMERMHDLGIGSVELYE